MRKYLAFLFLVPWLVLLLSLPTSTSASVITYTHDGAGRLVAADYSAGKSISYAYDLAGNLLQSSQPAPGLVVGTLLGNQIRLAWPSEPSGFVLERSSSLGSGALWTPVAAAPVSAGNHFFVTLPISKETVFYYRLRKN